jgi:lipoprotein-anchoring transpeptidase ErfK/SrfK
MEMADLLWLAGDYLWQSTLFVVVAAVLTRAFRRHGAHVRYWIWSADSRTAADARMPAILRQPVTVRRSPRHWMSNWVSSSRRRTARWTYSSSIARRSRRRTERSQPKAMPLGLTSKMQRVLRRGTGGLI